MEALLAFYTPDGPERCGITLADGSIIETENVASDPMEGYEIPSKVLVEHAQNLAGAWHTHPGAPSQLSVADYVSMLVWHTIPHFIIGNDGLTTYVVRDGAVVIDG